MKTTEVASAMTDQPFSPPSTAKIATLPRPGVLIGLWLATLPQQFPGFLVTVRQRAAEYGQEFVRELPAAFRRDAWLIAIILVYTGVGAGIAVRFEAVSILSVSLYYSTYAFILPMTLFLVFAGRALYFALIVRPKRPFAMLMSDLRQNLALPRRLAQGMPMLIFIPLLGGTFSVVKAAIPLMNPFFWDVGLERWDRWLHGGVAPWEWLQPVLGHPYLSQVINVGYNMWFLVLWFVWIWQFFTLRNPQLRMQFLLSVHLSWILIGSVLATLLSSAGPCYFGRVVGGPDPYQPLMTYLRLANDTTPIWALDTQQMLWKGYSLGELNLGAGISAMPSMHVAIATMFALLGWQTSRRMGILFTAFLCWIMVGSVHLGWHYALDGYVSILCALLIWWAVGWIVRRYPPQPASPSV
jgi:PAP2 superfamily protein